MREENRQMKEYLKANGIDAMPKYIDKGSMRGTWRLYNMAIKWWDNFELMGKLHKAGFRYYNGEPFNNFHGNGGVFQVFVRKV